VLDLNFYYTKSRLKNYKIIFMKNILLATFICVATTACNNSIQNTTNQSADTITTTEDTATNVEQKAETFITEDSATIATINKDIVAKKITAPMDVVNFYKPKGTQKEGKYTYNVVAKTIDSTTQEITVIEEGLLDDSKAAEKNVITINTQNGVSTVVSIQKSFKCYADRGHTDWGAELCK
jgi:CCR4-NOT transcriptional regulation complex NOT5 subunit